MAIKTRRAQPSRRGIYLQDSALQDTVFQPGKSFSYLLDPQARMLVILPDALSRNTVSKRQRGGAVQPVLDIRSRDALATLAGTDYWHVTIDHDRITVAGIQVSDNAVAASHESQEGPAAVGYVLDLAGICATRPAVVLSTARHQLAQAAGFSQLGFFDHWDTRAPALDVATRVPLLLDSLFSGAGLLDLGFRHAGFTIAYAVEQNPEAARTYRANLGDHIEVADIRTVPMDRFQSPVMAGGPPCVGFSNANRHSHFLDNPHNALVRSFIDAVQSNPHCVVFIMENVPQVMTAGSGMFKKEIFEALSDFTISAGVLDAADFGSAQHRRRAIFIGSKIGRIDLPTPGLTPARTVRDALRGLTPNTPNQRDVSVAKPITQARIAAVPPGGNVHDIPAAIRPSGSHSDMYRRLWWDQPSPTIVNPRKAMLIHPEESRILSVREAARIQDLPDDFVFQGSLNAKQQQVANGVPVRLARAIAEQVATAIHQWTIRTTVRMA